MRKKRNLIGFLGAWIIVLAFLGFPSSVRRILMVITGLVIAFVSFRGRSEEDRLIVGTDEQKNLS